MGMIGLGCSVKYALFKKWVLMGPMEHGCSIGPSIRNSLILQKFICTKESPTEVYLLRTT